MRLVHKSIDGNIDERLNIRKKEIPCLDSSWHYHAQYELLYISKSYGIRFVGDSVAQFFPGDLVLVGPYLPHLWRNDPSYYQAEDVDMVKTIIFHFTKNFIGTGTFNNPEFTGINNLLEEAKFGISFGRAVSEALHDELVNVMDLSPAQKTIKLLDILNRLSMTGDKEILSSSDMRQFTKESSQKIDEVIKFISDNYTKYICLNDVSDIACMTANSFCRYFKKATNKSFTQFLNEVRIRHASRILTQQDLAVSEVGFMVGYNSITNFNRQFKQIMGVTPNGFRQGMIDQMKVKTG